MVYIVESVAEYIYENCSEELKEDLSIKNIIDVLELMHHTSMTLTIHYLIHLQQKCFKRFR